MKIIQSLLFLSFFNCWAQTLQNHNADQEELSLNPSLSIIEYNPPKSIPEYRTPFIDTSFNNQIIRISDKKNFKNPTTYINKNDESNLTHSYSTIQPWNSDGTKLLMYGSRQNNYILDGNTYEIISGPITCEKHWFNTSPNKTHGFTGNEYRITNIKTDGTTEYKGAIYTFKGYKKVSLGPSEGTFDKDDKYCILLGIKTNNTKELIIFDSEIARNPTITDKNQSIIAKLPISRTVTQFDWAKISPSGKYILVNYGPKGQGNEKGLVVFDFINKNTVFITGRRLLEIAGHGDIAIDKFGDEVFFMAHNNQYTSVKLKKNKNNSSFSPITYGSIDSEDYKQPGANNGGHISGQNSLRPGWVYISGANIDTTSSSTGTGNINNHCLHGEIFSIKLDEMKTGKMIVERYAKHFSKKTNPIYPISTTEQEKLSIYNIASDINYKSQAQAVPNRDGTKVLFTSNMYDNKSIPYDYVVEKKTVLNKDSKQLILKYIDLLRNLFN